MWFVLFKKNKKKNYFFLFQIEIVVFYMGVKSGYSSPQTLTDQSTAIKRGEKGDLQVLRPSLMCCVPVRYYKFFFFFYFILNVFF